MKTPKLRKSIGWSPLRLGLPRVQRIWIIRGFLLIPFALACFALSPTARALLPPPAPDGGYLNNNTAEGNGSLFSLTTGIHNSAMGFQALHDNTSGGFNTATGFKALASNTTGSNNTAVGDVALANNGTGHDNTANGFEALFFNITGQFNTATGDQALSNGQSGSYNTATGFKALNNCYGINNTATGAQALFSNTDGGFNTANGFQALYSNTTGFENTANGTNTLYYNTTGTHNTATGVEALLSNITGTGNTASGFQALHNNRGSFNIGLGNQAGYNLTGGNRNIDIGNGGVAGESNTIRIGNIQTATYIVGISGSTATGGAAVFVASDGKLGTVTSSRRFKKDIADMNAASEALLALRPVTFHYKPELDKAGIPQYGLVAEEVAEVNPDLVVRDEKGEIYTVRYEAVNAMLLNEFLKEHRKNQRQEATIARLEKQIEVLAEGLQKVSAELESTKRTQQVALNNARL
jgi:hypothetical protein